MITVGASGRIDAAYRADLAAQRLEACAITAEGVSLTLAPHRMETLALRVQ